MGRPSQLCRRADSLGDAKGDLALVRDCRIGHSPALRGLQEPAQTQPKPARLATKARIKKDLAAENSAAAHSGVAEADSEPPLKKVHRHVKSKARGAA